jgi:hypothetical protein
MESDCELSFENLVTSRQELQRFCKHHYSSLTAFRDGVSFKLVQSEPALKGAVRHLSSTATCIESLLDCPKEFAPEREESLVLAKEFANAALQVPRDDWLSDGSARIYCRCRSMSLIVEHLPKYQSAIQEHLKYILSQLEDKCDRLAIGEGSKYQPEKDWYPPNAFHTYWTLQLICTIEQRFPKEFKKLRNAFEETRFNLSRLQAELLLWAHNMAGYQSALHEAGSSRLDSDQLAWSLATIITFQRDFQANLAEQDFIRHAMKCFFEHQTEIGIWRTGAPLFQFKNSGNAYCYIYETLAVLLRSALRSANEGAFLRQLLRPYAQNLLRLWRYAISTQIQLSPDGALLGWNSGNRANSTQPESWASASVYSFAQCLRRLVGIWTREAVVTKLKISSSRTLKQDAVLALAERGDTWAEAGKNVAAKLMALFVNPMYMRNADAPLEPDNQPISEDQARGAILFGPPGTSKTTLSRCVAEAIGWDYVELHASHFVADGLPNVQRTANAIFDQLLQLDRTVILFDEIDELVRAREKEPDAFGRFLTTSMLPKLAELWKLKKVIYFVATNYIPYFDTAVTRAQRFDALICVAPPSFDKKIRRLKELLSPWRSDLKIEVTQDQVDTAVQGARSNEASSGLLDPKWALAKLLLIRWDQLQELAAILRQQLDASDAIVLDQEILQKALCKLSDPSLMKSRAFQDYCDSLTYEQHDFGKITVWRIDGRLSPTLRSKLTRTTEGYWRISRCDFGDFSDFAGKCRQVAPGTLSCRC